MERFHLRCNIPYAMQRHGDEEIENFQNDIETLASIYFLLYMIFLFVFFLFIFDFQQNELDKEEKYFHEDFEIEDCYEKITVPDFSGGRRSKFIHDFKTVSIYQFLK